MMAEALIVHNQGRTLRTFGALVLAAALLGGLYSIGTMTWILVFLSLFAIPALVDLLLNPVSTFEMTDDTMRWKCPTQSGELTLDRIRQVRLDTRLDVSVRVTVMLVDGSKLRLPQDVLPAHKTLEEAFQARGIKVERHHFRVI